MRDVWSCDKCSHCVVTTTAGFVREVTWKCLDRNELVDDRDGCTFGDGSGQLIGSMAYDIDLSAMETNGETLGDSWQTWHTSGPIGRYRP